MDLTLTMRHGDWVPVKALIEEVGKRKILWDSECRMLQSDKRLEQKEAWERISDYLTVNYGIISAEDCKNVWKRERGKYRNSLNGKGPYNMSDAMSFLKYHLKAYRPRRDSTKHCDSAVPSKKPCHGNPTESTELTESELEAYEAATQEDRTDVSEPPVEAQAAETATATAAATATAIATAEGVIEADSVMCYHVPDSEEEADLTSSGRGWSMSTSRPATPMPHSTRSTENVGNKRMGNAEDERIDSFCESIKPFMKDFTTNGRGWSMRTSRPTTPMPHSTRSAENVRNKRMDNAEDERIDSFCKSIKPFMKDFTTSESAFFNSEVWKLIHAILEKRDET